MKAVFAFLVIALSFAQAQAANYKTTFQINNPGVTCEDENMSRFNGRHVSIAPDFSQISSSARTADGSVIQTEVRGVSATEWSPASCATLQPVPNVLSGKREIYIVRMEDQGKCNVHMIDEIYVNIGAGNPTLYGKTAYPVVGDDFSKWSAEMCRLTEDDFKKAIQRVVRGS
jgi:hypothetical protein